MLSNAHSYFFPDVHAQLKEYFRVIRFFQQQHLQFLPINAETNALFPFFETFFSRKDYFYALEDVLQEW